MEITVAVYNIGSVPKMLEFARLTYGFGVRRLVLAKVFGAAAQQIGDVFKLAFRVGGQVIVLNDLNEAVELLKPEAVYALTRPDAEVRPLPTPLDGHVMLVAHGADLAFSPRELPPQAVLTYAVDRDVGAIGQLAVALVRLLRGVCDG